MGLAAPLFLLGVLAVALPLWLHRLQTQSSDRRPFSSAMLLETTEERVHLQKKLKYFLLLGLRIAFLLLVALAFAKPYLERTPSPLAAGAGTELVVVDTSASMGRTGTFDQAQSVAGRIVDSAPAGALLQVLAADDGLHLRSDLSSDKADHRAAIAGLTAGALRLDYGATMAAVDRLAERLPPPVTVHLVSDFQASAMPVRFADVVPVAVAELEPHVVGTGQPFNWSVEYLRETADGVDAAVLGFGDRERVADVELSLDGAVIRSQGLSETGSVSLQFDGLTYEEGDSRLEIRINTDDDMTVDNRWYHVVQNEPPSPVPLITLDSGGLPVTYLSAALAADAGAGHSILPMIVGDFDARVLSRYRWAIIDDLGAINDDLAESLIEFVDAGGSLLAFAGPRAAALEVMPLTGYRQAAAAVGIAANEFVSPGQVDTGHPALARTEGWHNVNVSRNLPVELQADDRVLIRLENNEPFMVERRIGAGRLLIVLNGLDNRWNDLPVRPVFVSFMVEAASYLSGINEVSRTWTVGASLPLSLIGGASGQVVDPDGNTVLSLADTTRAQQIKLDKPGFYEVYTPEGEMLVAANVDPRESDLDKIPQEMLDRWQEAAAGSPGITTGQSAIVEAEPLELWHWVLLVLALIVIGESMLGNVYLAPLARASR